MSEVNPLLQKLKLPGATYRLPSQGLFYDQGELDHSVVDGEIEVHPMTAYDEIILNTPDKLLSGKAILEVFARCIPQILRPELLLAKDVDYLMICLRAVSFGDTMEVTHEHTCDHKSHTYSLSLPNLLSSSKEINPTTLRTEYTVTLPNGQIVSLQPLTYQHIVDLYRTTAMIGDNDLTQQDAERLIIDTLVGVIKSVDGVTDSTDIKQWLVSIPLGWKRQIERVIHNVSNWGVEFSSDKKCKGCGEVITIPISANPINFFT